MARTSWDRLLREIGRQAPKIAAEAGISANELVFMLVAAARLEGGPGTEPGVGDNGNSHGWYQFNVGEDKTAHGHLFLAKGHSHKDFLDEKKVVAYWAPILAETLVSLGGSGGGGARLFEAIFTAENPAERYKRANWKEAVRQANQYVRVNDPQAEEYDYATAHTREGPPSDGGGDMAVTDGNMVPTPEPDTGGVDVPTPTDTDDSPATADDFRLLAQQLRSEVININSKILELDEPFGSDEQEYEALVRQRESLISSAVTYDRMADRLDEMNAADADGDDNAADMLALDLKQQGMNLDTAIHLWDKYVDNEEINRRKRADDFSRWQDEENRKWQKSQDDYNRWKDQHEIDRQKDNDKFQQWQDQENRQFQQSIQNWNRYVDENNLNQRIDEEDFKRWANQQDRRLQLSIHDWNKYVDENNLQQRVNEQHFKQWQDSQDRSWRHSDDKFKRWQDEQNRFRQREQDQQAQWQDRQTRARLDAQTKLQASSEGLLRTQDARDRYYGARAQGNRLNMGPAPLRNYAPPKFEDAFNQAGGVFGERAPQLSSGPTRPAPGIFTPGQYAPPPQKPLSRPSPFTPDTYTPPQREGLLKPEPYTPGVFTPSERDESAPPPSHTPGLFTPPTDESNPPPDGGGLSDPNNLPPVHPTPHVTPAQRGETRVNANGDTELFVGGDRGWIVVTPGFVTGEERTTADGTLERWDGRRWVVITPEQALDEKVKQPQNGETRRNANGRWEWYNAATGQWTSDFGPQGNQQQPSDTEVLDDAVRNADDQPTPRATPDSRQQPNNRPPPPADGQQRGGDEQALHDAVFNAQTMSKGPLRGSQGNVPLADRFGHGRGRRPTLMEYLGLA